MNCMELRRSLLVNPRLRDGDLQTHLAECAACSAFARQMESLESRIEEAARVPVPEALDERVLLRQSMRRPARFAMLALAASITLAVGLGILVVHERGPGGGEIVSGVALGSEHPAVAAISYVLDNEPQLLEEGRRGDPAVMRGAFARLGLNLPANGVTVRYLGKCPVVPSGTGEHVVLDTPVGRVTLILVPEQPFTSPVVVADRDKTAVARAVRTGGYILIADSLKNARQIEKMLM
ncbi:MAG: DUF3379 family protein [Betaproteobacteria bacterium]|nr:DUF3379 family protein [Betaproteobacteria bacterium]